MKHQDITVDKLISDPSFRRWVLSSTPADAVYWRSWIKQHPEYQAEVEEAKKLLLALRPKEIPGSSQAEERVWAGIREKIMEQHPPLPTLRGRPKFPAWKVAASIVLCLASTVLLYRWLAPSSYVSESTAYGEIREIRLPDSSRVVLNANSSLRYPKDWAAGADREVWLEGEAFFKVERRLSVPAHQNGESTYIKFTVHADPLAVEVLGTEFSVNHRGQETQVVLSKGKVRVKDREEKQEDVILKPGEMLSYTGKTMLLTQVDASTETSWKEELIILRNEPLARIFGQLEDVYGYEINGADQAMLERRFSGSYPRDSVQVLFEKLEKLYQLTITKNGKKITVKSNF